MKFDFKIDYISQTAAHYTTFTLSEESNRIIEENRQDQADRAQQVQTDIGQRARDKALMQMKGNIVNTYS